MPCLKYQHIAICYPQSEAQLYLSFWQYQYCSLNHRLFLVMFKDEEAEECQVHSNHKVLPEQRPRAGPVGLLRHHPEVVPRVVLKQVHVDS